MTQLETLSTSDGFTVTLPPIFKCCGVFGSDEAKQGIRAILRESAQAADQTRPPLARIEVMRHQWSVQAHLTTHARRWRALADDPERSDQVYVLEFAGPHPFVMFGHTRQIERRVRRHCLDANPHGYALVDGWATPLLWDALTVERETIGIVERVRQVGHHHERFYGMPFADAVRAARIIYGMIMDPNRE